jgi:Tfp pilus assembly protein PilV
MVVTRARHRLASNDGFALMEVIVSAAVLVLVVLGVLAGLDAATSTAGANKARTVAATLAEKDQERLRGMRVPDIDKMNLLPYTVKVGNVTYTVESKAVWVNDASGEEIGCTLNKSQASYMRITSTVTSPITGNKVKPVVISSIVAPQVGTSASGSLAVLVKDAKDHPVQGVTVSAVGPKPVDAEGTNDLGCAVFGDLTAGTYKVTLSKNGYVDKEGVVNPSNDATVTAGTTSTMEFAYDNAATITLSVKNQPGAASEPAKTVVAANQELGGGLRSFGPNASSVISGLNDPDTSDPSGTTFTLTNLFPFVNGYTFYSGGCTANDPSKSIANYFDSYTGKVILDPGQNGGTINVYEPTVATIFVRRGTSGSTAVTSTPVWAYPTNTGCTGSRIFLGYTNNSTGKITTNAGLPYGTYTLCAFQSSSGRRGTANITINSTAGIPAQQTLDAVTSSPTKKCGLTAVDSSP